MKASSIAVLLCGLMFSACAHVYHAPDNTKLEASTKRLANAVTKATNTAERAKAHVEAAQKAADKEAAKSAAVLTQLNELVELLPPELRARGAALKDAVNEQQVAAGEIVEHVNAARSEHVQLFKDLTEANAAKFQVDKDKQEYYEKTDKLAAIATKNSKELAWYRRRWFLGWAIFISGVIACIVLAIVKWGAKWTAKLGAAYGKIGL